MVLCHHEILSFLIVTTNLTLKQITDICIVFVHVMKKGSDIEVIVLQKEIKVETIC